jgi:CHAT domain-containing protein
MFSHCYLRRLRLASSICVLCALQVSAQTIATGEPALELARAQQQFDEGRLREAANALEKVAAAGGKNIAASPEKMAAIRLLAQVYFRSSDYVAAAKTAEEYVRHSSQSDAEVVLILADSYLALGRTDDARVQLEKLKSALAGDSATSVDDVRVGIAIQRLTSALTSTGTKSSMDAADVPQLDFSRQRNLGEQRFEIITLAANRYLDTNQLDQAVELLNREIPSPSYGDDERTLLRLQLVDCYDRKASREEDGGKSTSYQSTLAAESHVLDSLAADFAKLRTSATDTDDFLKLLSREGVYYERLGTLARARAHILSAETPQNQNTKKALQSLAAKHFQNAAKAYQQLAERANGIDRDYNTLQTQSDATDSQASSGRGLRYRDVALCGLQRAYEALRLSSAAAGNERLMTELCRVSDQLANERQQRLLPLDPMLYEAKRARASVYASLDDRDSQKRAAAAYRELVAYWMKHPRPQPELQAAALIGLAEVLRALDNTKDAYRSALDANALISGAPIEDNAAARRNRALLNARIENSLGVTSIGLGQYRDALSYLTAADNRLQPFGERFAELRQQNEQMLLVLSRVKVYRALLNKAEAQYADAATQVREGRELRERLDVNSDSLAYHLAEASVLLAQVRDRQHQQGRSMVDPAATSALAQADAALKRARPLIETASHQNAAGKAAVELPYRYLGALAVRLHGDLDNATKEFFELARACEQQGDGKTAAKCYMQLAQLTIDQIAATPGSQRVSGKGLRDEMSRSDVAELRDLKVRRRSAIGTAAKYADRAVELFRSLDRISTSPDDGEEQTSTILPSLHFQASYLAARLQILLAAVDGQIVRLDTLLASRANKSPGAAIKPSDGLSSAEYRRRAIGLLEDAVQQAERPASTTTQVRLNRAKFFARYAPAYDLLVDLYVSSAVAENAAATFDEASPGYADIRRAIEIADLARNRTFREQIDGWRQTAGNDRKSVSFNWDIHLKEVLDPNIALLMYHLDGPQLLDSSLMHANPEIQLGGGHLFVVLNQGHELRYFRLRHVQPGSETSVALSRQIAEQLVRRHIDWIGDPEAAQDWGRAAQRALTQCLLPNELLNQLSTATAEATPASQLLIVADGALHQLPFESLLLPESSRGSDRKVHYAIDDLPPIRYGPSLSVLVGITEREIETSQSSEQLLTVGNPAYPASDRQNQIGAWKELLRQISGSDAGFVPLAHAEEECDSVYASFEESPSAIRTKLVQAEATETAVRQHIGASRFIHIAAHGCVDYQNDNLFGALVFTPGTEANDPDNDGLLQLREIYTLNFSTCELAVLSACQTYVGPQRPLEAGTSMARAFLEQGAKRVVCSQWSTDDRATTELMKSFFDAIQAARSAGKEIDYAAALQVAKRAIRQNPERAASPKYWAPFVLVGAS